MKRLDHILHLDEFYKYGIALFIFVLGFFHIWAFLICFIYMIWIRRQIHIIFLVFLIVVISLSYALLTNFDKDSIQQDVVVVAIDIYDHYSRYTIKYDRYKFHMYDNHDAYQLGDVLYINGDIISYREQTVDFGFDLKQYFLSFHVYGKIDIKDIQLIDHKLQVFQVREKLKQPILSLKSSAYITSFIFGEKVKDEQTIDVYTNFDILYLFTISGLHIYVFMMMLKKIMFMFGQFVHELYTG